MGCHVFFFWGEGYGRLRNRLALLRRASDISLLPGTEEVVGEARDCSPKCPHAHKCTVLFRDRAGVELPANGEGCGNPCETRMRDSGQGEAGGLASE